MIPAREHFPPTLAADTCWVGTMIAKTLATITAIILKVLNIELAKLMLNHFATTDVIDHCGLGVAFCSPCINNCTLGQRLNLSHCG